MYDDCPADDRDPVDIAMRLLAIRDHVRAEVIAQVMEQIHYVFGRDEHGCKWMDEWLDELSKEER